MLNDVIKAFGSSKQQETIGKSSSTAKKNVLKNLFASLLGKNVQDVSPGQPAAIKEQTVKLSSAKSDIAQKSKDVMQGSSLLNGKADFTPSAENYFSPLFPFWSDETAPVFFDSPDIFADDATEASRLLSFMEKQGKLARGLKNPSLVGMLSIGRIRQAEDAPETSVSASENYPDEIKSTPTVKSNLKKKGALQQAGTNLSTQVEDIDPELEQLFEVGSNSFAAADELTAKRSDNYTISKSRLSKIEDNADDDIISVDEGDVPKNSGKTVDSFPGDKTGVKVQNGKTPVAEEDHVVKDKAVKSKSEHNAPVRGETSQGVKENAEENPAVIIAESFSSEAGHTLSEAGDEESDKPLAYPHHIFRHHLNNGRVKKEQVEATDEQEGADKDTAGEIKQATTITGQASNPDSDKTGFMTGKLRAATSQDQADKKVVMSTRGENQPTGDENFSEKPSVLKTGKQTVNGSQQTSFAGKQKIENRHDKEDGIDSEQVSEPGKFYGKVKDAVNVNANVAARKEKQTGTEHVSTAKNSDTRADQETSRVRDSAEKISGMKKSGMPNDEVSRAKASGQNKPEMQTNQTAQQNRNEPNQGKGKNSSVEVDETNDRSLKTGDGKDVFRFQSVNVRHAANEDAPTPKSMPTDSMNRFSAAAENTHYVKDPASDLTVDAGKNQALKQETERVEKDKVVVKSTSESINNNSSSNAPHRAGSVPDQKEFSQNRQSPDNQRIQENVFDGTERGNSGNQPGLADGSKQQHSFSKNTSGSQEVDKETKTNDTPKTNELSVGLADKASDHKQSIQAASKAPVVGKSSVMLMSEDISQGVRLLASQNEMNVTIKTATEELGQLKIHMAKTQGGTDVLIQVDNEISKAILESTLAELRKNLDALHIQIAGVKVQVDDESTRQHFREKTLTEKWKESRKKARIEDVTTSTLSSEATESRSIHFDSHYETVA